MSDEREALTARWRRRFPADEAVRDEVLNAYAEPHRAYHNLVHLLQVLTTIDDLAGAADDPAVVELAAWFHDVVYDPRAGDNEERSADWLARVQRPLGLADAAIERGVALILSTRSHDAAPGDRDAAVLSDADLAILSADEAGYDDYARRIRLEYAWVPDEDYRSGRARVLRSFLEREHIYHTAGMQGREPRARANLRRELSRFGVL